MSEDPIIFIILVTIYGRKMHKIKWNIDSKFHQKQAIPYKSDYHNKTTEKIKKNKQTSEKQKLQNKWVQRTGKCKEDHRIKIFS